MNVRELLSQPWPPAGTRVDCERGYAVVTDMPGLVDCFRVNGERVGELTLPQAAKAIGRPVRP